MTIYQINPSEPYLESVADFVIGSHSDLSIVKIIVASSAICSSLQRIFVTKSGKGASILPNIIPVAAISSESELIYKVPSDNIETMGHIAQKLLLMDIISNLSLGLDARVSGGRAYETLQASRLRDPLLSLFNEIEAGEVDINLLPAIVEIDSAAHWIVTASFLKDAYDKWQRGVATAGKISSAVHQKMVLDLEKSDRLAPTVTVGLTGGSKALDEFIAFLASSEHGIVILPPFSLDDIKQELEPTSPFYAIKKITGAAPSLRLMRSSCDVPKNLASSPREARYPIYLEAQDQFEEAELVADIVSLGLRPAGVLEAEPPQRLESSASGSIAIVTNSRDFVSQIKLSLKKRNIETLSIHGDSLIDTKPIEFILLLAGSLLLKDIEKFAGLLKTPYLISEEIYDFEMKHLRISGANDLSLIIASSRLQQKFDRLYKLGGKRMVFTDLLKSHIECALDIAPYLFEGEDGLAASEFFRELIEGSGHLHEIDADIYPDLLKSLLGGARYFPSKSSAHVTVLNSQDAAFLDFDTFILCDCNEGSFPAKSRPDPWMNNKMRQTLGLKSEAEYLGTSHYHFYLLMQKKNLYITRSLKNQGRDQIASRFLTYYGIASLGLDPRVSCSKGFLRPLDQVREKQHEKNLFPSTISATSLELLIRNPYGFYAKKILGLSKINDINEEVRLADFGSLIHDIFEQYAHCYDASSNKLELLLDISNEVFANFHDHHKKDLWRQKFIAMAGEFIALDEARRQEAAHLYSEAYGEITLTIRGNPIKLTAIADRIELTKSGELFIMDYKTGAVPQASEVRSGIAPQLILEAIIAAEGGFKTIPAIVPTKIIYIKIASAQPYFQITEIEITQEDLEAHKRGLIDLLGYYLKGDAVYLPTPDPRYEPKYNDYKHLARKL
jgi:ATP-dependent helicase/nuclease subunit B